jgi:ribosome-binding ATPase
VKSVGIVGLPGAGASTIFTALTHVEGATPAHTAQAVLPVTDPRVDTLAELHSSPKRTYSQLRFVEVSGRVRRGARGSGSLSAELLGHLRECDALLLVTRAFDGVEDPTELLLELALADAEVVAGKLERTRKEARLASDERAKRLVPVLERISSALDSGHQLRDQSWSDEERGAVADLSLITLKPALVLANVGEVAPGGLPPNSIPIAGRLEVELGGVEPEEAEEILASYGQTRAIDRVVRAIYDELSLITFLTTGPPEARAWEIPAGTTAPRAAGAVHSDMERGFIRAEVCAFEDVVGAGGWPKAKAAGTIRQEGRSYVMREGDVVEFRFAV